MLNSGTPPKSLAIWLGFLCALLVSCGGVSRNPTTPAPTISASAASASIAAGQSTTLTWTTANASGVTIDNGIGSQPANGRVTVTPGATTTYSFTAISASGATAATAVTVTVTQPLPIPTVQFSANPTNILRGGTSTLTWSTANATGFSIDSGVGAQPVNGSAQVSPGATTTYTATATGAGGTATAQVQITVKPAPGVSSVLTYHNDQARDGLNANEAILNPANVTPAQFGKKHSYAVDGQIYGQPLYMPNLTINGAPHNVVFVATEHDTVYAFDANGEASSPLWQKSIGEAFPDSNPAGLQPEIGITSTAVIDASSGTIYLLAVDISSGHKFMLHALDVTSGAEKFGGPMAVSASVAGSGALSNNGQVPLEGGCLQRAGLALANGKIYLGFGSCQHGWLLAYDATTLAPAGVFNASPNGAGGTIWMGGGAPAVDGAGNLYVTTGTNFVDYPPGYNDSFLKLAPELGLTDYFQPANDQYLINHDADLGAGGAVLMPDNGSGHPHEIIGGGKDGRIFVVDRDNLGKSAGDPNSNDCSAPGNVVQCVKTGTSQGNNIHSTPAYWNGRLYIHSNGDVLKAWSWSNGLLSNSAIDSGAVVVKTHGATVSISSNGNSDGIVWEIDNGNYSANGSGPAILRAFDAMNVATELYNSTMSGSRDTAGPAVKFTVPTVADGQVFVGTGKELDIYGLLP